MSEQSETDNPPSPRRPRVVVIGSANTDMTARIARHPQPGETVLGSEFAMLPGGKGANQAVAAARLGGVVTFVACVGADSLGDALVQGYEAEGIDTQFVVRDPDAPTGVALVMVAEGTGENAIVVASGANSCLSVPLVHRAQDAVRDADVVICQLETPLETVIESLKMAHAAGVQTILNPAPAQELDDTLLSLVSVLTPNLNEATRLTGNFDPEAAAKVLRGRGVGQVIVTLGPAGAMLVTDAGTAHQAARAAGEVVDTTAAGDCFTGALAVALGEGKTLSEAAAFAGAAASLSVTRAGAQPSLPSRFEVDEILTGTTAGTKE